MKYLQGSRCVNEHLDHATYRNLQILVRGNMADAAFVLAQVPSCIGFRVIHGTRLSASVATPRRPEGRRNKSTSVSYVVTAACLLLTLLTCRMSLASACSGFAMAVHNCGCQHAIRRPRPVTVPRSRLLLRDLHQRAAAHPRQQRVHALKKVPNA